MTAEPPNDNTKKLKNLKSLANYCKKPGHVIRECRKRKKMERLERNDPSTRNSKPLTSKAFAPRPHCQRTGKCSSSPSAANRP